MYGWLMARNVGKEIGQTETKLVLALTTLFVKHPDIHLLTPWSHLGPPCRSPSVHRCLYFTRVRKRQVVGLVGKARDSNGPCPNGKWQGPASHCWSGSSTLTWPNHDCSSHQWFISHGKTPVLPIPWNASRRSLWLKRIIYYLLWINNLIKGQSQVGWNISKGPHWEGFIISWGENA